ncbi:MAG: DUF4126 domain-containing protein [Vulcanimicrobiota bacterium]
MDIIISLFLGASLAATAGFRAFLPLFLLGLGFRMGWADVYQLAPAFAWLSSTPALIALGSATIFEIGADKVPAVDTALDTVYTAVRPTAGAVAVLAVISHDNPLVAYVAAVCLAGGATLPIHLLKTGTRVAANTATAGVAAPVKSTCEDVAALGLGVTALVAPVVAFVAALAGGLIAFLLLRRWRARRAKNKDG